MTTSSRPTLPGSTWVPLPLAGTVAPSRALPAERRACQGSRRAQRHDAQAGGPARLRPSGIGCAEHESGTLSMRPRVVASTSSLTTRPLTPLQLHRADPTLPCCPTQSAELSVQKGMVRRQSPRPATEQRYSSHALMLRRPRGMPLRPLALAPVLALARSRLRCGR